MTPREDDWRRRFSHPLLREVFDELMQSSPRFAAAMDKLLERGFGLQVGVPDELLAINAGRSKRDQIRIDPSYGAVSAYSPEPDGSVPQAGAFVDVDKLHDMTRARPGAPVDSARARTLIRDALVHELYGHIAPIGAVGNVSGAARDPRRGEPFARSPVGQRENEIRLELGLEPRQRYGLID